jgi:2-polyprenyl-6-hydroxyphenyl methylase/3-demethylubiquinone-9 3-methyltransferase
MKNVNYQDSWPEIWKYSYQHDLWEIYGDTSYRGYAYAYANRQKHTLELVQKVAKPGAKVLDIAAAQGNFSLSLAELGYEVTWNDLRADLADYVKLKWEHGLIHYVPEDVFALGFESEFDVVLITEVIEHVAHPDEFLRKIAQMVKLGGYIVMSTPNGEYFRNPLPRFSDCPDPSQYEAIQFQPNSDGHIFLLHLDEIESMAHKSGLEIVETQIITNTLTRGHLKLETLLKLLPRPWIDSLENLTQSLPMPLKRKLNVTTIALLTRPFEGTS